MPKFKPEFKATIEKIVLFEGTAPAATAAAAAPATPAAQSAEQNEALAKLFAKQAVDQVLGEALFKDEYRTGITEAVTRAVKSHLEHINLNNPAGDLKTLSDKIDIIGDYAYCLAKFHSVNVIDTNARNVLNDGKHNKILEGSAASARDADAIGRKLDQRIEHIYGVEVFAPADEKAEFDNYAKELDPIFKKQTKLAKDNPEIAVTEGTQEFTTKKSKEELKTEYDLHDIELILSKLKKDISEQQKNFVKEHPERIQPYLPANSTDIPQYLKTRSFSIVNDINKLAKFIANEQARLDEVRKRLAEKRDKDVNDATQSRNASVIETNKLFNDYLTYLNLTVKVPIDPFSPAIILRDDVKIEKLFSDYHAEVAKDASNRDESKIKKLLAQINYVLSDNNEDNKFEHKRDIVSTIRLYFQRNSEHDKTLNSTKASAEKEYQDALLELQTESDGFITKKDSKGKSLNDHFRDISLERFALIAQIRKELEKYNSYNDQEKTTHQDDFNNLVAAYQTLAIMPPYDAADKEDFTKLGQEINKAKAGSVDVEEPKDESAEAATKLKSGAFEAKAEIKTGNFSFEKEDGTLLHYNLKKDERFVLIGTPKPDNLTKEEITFFKKDLQLPLLQKDPQLKQYLKGDAWYDDELGMIRFRLKSHRDAETVAKLLKEKSYCLLSAIKNMMKSLDEAKKLFPNNEEKQRKYIESRLKKDLAKDGLLYLYKDSIFREKIYDMNEKLADPKSKIDITKFYEFIGLYNEELKSRVKPAGNIPSIAKKHVQKSAGADTADQEEAMRRAMSMAGRGGG